MWYFGFTGRWAHRSQKITVRALPRRVSDVAPKNCESAFDVLSVNFDVAIDRLVFMILVDPEGSRVRRLRNARRCGLVAASRSEVPEGGWLDSGCRAAASCVVADRSADGSGRTVEVLALKFGIEG